MAEEQTVVPENAPISVPAKPKNIHEAISAVMAEVGGVEKSRKNLQQGYQFRGIADIYLACQLVMAKHGMHVVPHHIIEDSLTEHETKGGGVIWRARIRVLFRAYAGDGSSLDLETIGEAMDTGDKASNKAMSVAMKYALIQLFALPEKDPSIDPETSSPETVPTSRKETGKPKRPPEEVAKINALAEALQQAGIVEPLGWVSKELGKPITSSEQITVGELDSLLTIARAKKAVPK